MSRVLLAVGGNLGDRAVTLALSVALLAHLPKTQLLARSTWHETAPVGSGGPKFLNGAILLETALTAQDLASCLKQIETQLGRERHKRWDARTIDIDVLLMGNQVLDSPELQIPHPRMAHRRFVLDPACEIAGEMVHPSSGWTLAALRCHWQTSQREVTVQSADCQLAHWLTVELSHGLAREDGDQNLRRTIKLVPLNQRPAMVIALDNALQLPGPVVRITSTDRTVILEEALAAVDAAWPD